MIKIISTWHIQYTFGLDTKYLPFCWRAAAEMAGGVKPFATVVEGLAFCIF